MRKRAAVPLASAGAAVLGLGAAAAIKLRNADRRHRLGRSARVWRLTARRGAHWGVVRVRGAGRDEQARQRLEEQFAIRTAEDVAAELGNMKGAIMKAGQMISFIAEGLPPEAQEALATLQADVPPMAPSLAEGVIRDELGDDPERLFLDWNPEPIAAASIGQVHRGVLRDGRDVAVKVQYPGVDKAIRSDLDNAEVLYGLFSQVAMKNLDVHAIVDELRARMGDELDYRIEAACQEEFAERYAAHPFIHVPRVVPERSAQRVLTTEWAEGRTWAEFERTATGDEKQKAAEVLFRFAQGSIQHHRVFNGDPHPGNYRFLPDGSVVFLDFGLVKRWAPGEMEMMAPCLDAILARDARGSVDALVAAGFLSADHGQDPDLIYDYLSSPYIPYLDEEFTYTREFTGEILAKFLDITGPFGAVMEHLNMPASYVILDRVVWGVSALLGKLEATNNWRGILAEYRADGPPATPLGELEAAWRETLVPA